MSTPFPEQVAPGGVLVYPQIKSPNYVAGSSGWAVFSNGNVEFNSGTFRGTVTGGAFDGADFVINSSGAFFYTGTPALGNLSASIASAAGTDGFGNAYKAGVSAYGTSGNSIELLPGSTAAVRLATGDANEATPGLIGTLIDGTGTIRALASQIQAPQFTGETASAIIRMESSSEDLTTTSPDILLSVDNTAGSNTQMVVNPTNVRFNKNTSLNLVYLDAVNNQILAGYPVVAATTAGGITAETWHTLTLSASWTGTLQYKLYPDNTVGLRSSGTLGVGTRTTGTVIATLPAAYSPAFQMDVPIQVTANTSGAASINSPFFRIATSGQIAVDNISTQVATNVSVTARFPLD